MPEALTPSASVTVTLAVTACSSLGEPLSETCTLGAASSVTLGVGVAHRHRKRLALIRLARRVAVAVAADRLAVDRPGIVDAGSVDPVRIRHRHVGGDRMLFVGR